MMNELRERFQWEVSGRYAVGGNRGGEGKPAEIVSKGRARLSERAVERGVGFDQPAKWERIRIPQRTALPTLRSQAKEGSDGPCQLCLFHSFETVSAGLPVVGLALDGRHRRSDMRYHIPRPLPTYEHTLRRRVGDRRFLRSGFLLAPKHPGQDTQHQTERRQRHQHRRHGSDQ